MKNRLNSVLIGSPLMWIIITLGVLLRIIQYGYNCSLSIDEASLALNIIDRTYAEIFNPLDYNQGSPIGFLIILKWLTLTFNSGELILRLLSLVCGILSIFLFKILAEKILAGKCVPVALGLFAISNTLIFYSAQVKQYTVDVMIAIILCLMANRLRANKDSLVFIIVFGMVGAVATWFSHPSVFVLGGIGIRLAYFKIIKKNEHREYKLIVCYVLWLLGFISVYVVSLKNLGNHSFLLHYWSDSFMPIPPTSVEDVKWYITYFFKLFKKTLGFSLKGVCGLTFMLGCYSMFRRRRHQLCDLTLPILLVLFASALQQYPFYGRLLLFITPMLILLIAEGVNYIWDSTTDKPVIVCVIVTLLFLHPVFYAGKYLVKPRYEEEIKPVMKYIQNHRNSNDAIYLYYRSEIAFTYYADRYGMNKQDCIVGVASKYDWNGYKRDLEKLRGHTRVWLLFSHIYNWEDIDDERLFIYYLDNMGKKLDSVKHHGASAYLYDLTEEL